jgi:hypothetical protein
MIESSLYEQILIVLEIMSNIGNEREVTLRLVP